MLRVQVGTSDPGGLPARPMTLTDGPAWAFGLLHLYQLPRFDLLSTPKIAIAIIVPLLLVAVILVGVPRLGEVTAAGFLPLAWNDQTRITARRVCPVR